jgi:hypothetical protein
MNLKMIDAPLVGIRRMKKIVKHIELVRGLTQEQSILLFFVGEVD